MVGLSVDCSLHNWTSVATSVRTLSTLLLSSSLKSDLVRANQGFPLAPRGSVCILQISPQQSLCTGHWHILVACLQIVETRLTHKKSLPSPILDIFYTHPLLKFCLVSQATPFHYAKGVACRNRVETCNTHNTRFISPTRHGRYKQRGGIQPKSPYKAQRFCASYLDSVYVVVIRPSDAPYRVSTRYKVFYL